MWCEINVLTYSLWLFIYFTLFFLSWISKSFVLRRYYCAEQHYPPAILLKSHVHQKKIKSKQAHFKPFTKIYKYSPFTAFQRSPLPLKLELFLTEPLLFELAPQETTNSAPLSRNIYLNFFFKNSLLLCFIISCFPSFSWHRCVFNKSLTGYSRVGWDSHCFAPPQSADRVRDLRSRVQGVGSGKSVLVLLVQLSWRTVGDRRVWGRGRSEGHRGKNKSLELVSCWVDPEPSGCQLEVFALPLTSTLFVFKPVAAALLSLKCLHSVAKRKPFSSLITTTWEIDLLSLMQLNV